MFGFVDDVVSWFLKVMWGFKEMVMGGEMKWEI